MQALPADLPAEEAQGPGCAKLVQDMCWLFDQLKQLSRLELGREQEVRGGWQTVGSRTIMPRCCCGSCRPNIDARC